MRLEIGTANGLCFRIHQPGGPAPGKAGAITFNWLTAEQGKQLLSTPDGASLRARRDYVTLAILLGCGLRRAELTALRIENIQQGEEHWVIADLVGKGGHIRTAPVQNWV